MKKWILHSFTIIFLLLSNTIWADTNPTDAAKQVIQDYFSALKDHKIQKAGDLLAPQFIYVRIDGIPRNKDQMIDLLNKGQFHSFELKDFKFSQSGDIIIATYNNSAAGKTKDNKQYTSKPIPRMTVLQKQGDKWLIVAHANLDPFKKEFD